MEIDIIVPIYNAYEFTIQCVESVLKYTTGEYNLILINDSSPDKRVAEYLSQLEKKQISNLYILNNESNLGFVGTVNKGMKLSKNDVILLNSDTEVTPGWLAKMMRCAYSNDRIATVTPLTNNGTICSIPNFCEDNLLPENLTLNEYAEIVEHTSLELYPDLPTAVGFCMYIKRAIINEIGIFDEETFGKGYGEENDFCCRALEAGYTHVLCDDTFIYHKGTTSFLGDKEKYTNINGKILNNRYPYYDVMIQKFIEANPLKKIHDNIKFQLRVRNSKKNILFVLHNDFISGTNHPIGGTEFHVKDIVDYAKNINPIIMYVKGQEIICQIIQDEIVTLSFPFESTIYDFTLSSYSYKKKIEEIIRYFRIDAIHLHHFRTHSLDIVDIAKENDIPLLITLHDFYCICPKITLLNKDGIYCKDIKDTQMCNDCLKDALGYNTFRVDYWNEKMYKVLKSAQKVYAPSKSVKNIFEEYYQKSLGEFNVEITVVEHGIDFKKFELQSRDAEVFKIAFIGGISPEKGSKAINRMICNNNNKNIEWHIFGNIGDQSLNLLEKKNLIKHGRYERDQIIEKLVQNNIQLVCILSICPETYSYTLSEAISAQIPVLATDIGALGERVRKYNCGWLIPVNSKENDILRQITDIKEDVEGYKYVLEKLAEIQLPTKEDRAQIYQEEYLKASTKKQPSKNEFNKEVLFRYKIYINTEDNEIIENGDHEILIELREQNQILKEHIGCMESTIGWKMLEYIRRKAPRIKSLGKKLIYFGAKYFKK